MDFLPACVESVQNLDKNFPDGHAIKVQHFITNDASTDETEAYLREVVAEDKAKHTDSRDRRVFVRHLRENAGHALALHEASLELSDYINSMSRRGIPAALTIPHYVSIVDGDDMLPQNTAQLYTQVCAERSDIAKREAKAKGLIRPEPRFPLVMFGLAKIIDAAGNELPDVPHAPNFNRVPDTSDIWEFSRRMQECNHIPSYVLLEYWRYPPNLHYAENYRCLDWALGRAALTEIALHSDAPNLDLHVLQAPVYTYRIHDSQMSKADSEDGTWELEGAKMDADPNLNPFHPDHDQPASFQPIIDALNGLPVKGATKPVCRKH
jgi:hypothetical protein